MKKIFWILTCLILTNLVNSQSTGSTTTGYGELKYQIFNASSTWTSQAGIATVTIEAYGGGGAGGTASGNPSTGGGGKGGGYAKKSGIAVTQATVYTVTVGAGGVTDVSDADPSWFNSTATVLAPGGGTGASAITNSSNGAGSTATLGTAVGDVIYTGGNGATGDYTSGSGYSGAGGGGATNTGNGTVGNSTTGGVFGGGNPVGNSTVGNPGTQPGGGGSGGKANNNPDSAGGAGAAGRIVVEHKTTHLLFF